MTRAEVRLDAVGVFPPAEGSWGAVAEVTSVGRCPNGQELEETDPKRTRSLESLDLAVFIRVWKEEKTEGLCFPWF